MNELKELINETIESIGGMTELFYQQKSHDAFDKMDRILGMITEISNMVVEQDLAEDANRILNILLTVLEAFEEKDYILLSDVLQYDMTEELQEIYNGL